MSAFETAINQILWEIPEEIIEDAMIEMRSRERRIPVRLPEQIRRKILMGRVMTDLNDIGGVGIEIDLSRCGYRKLTNYERIYEIPLAALQGRNLNKISKVLLNVTSNYAERVPGQSTRSFTTSPIERSVQSITASNSPIPMISNANVDILTDNTILIRDHQNFSTDLKLECKLEYSEDFHELPREYYSDFCQLAILATKAWCYTRLSLQLDRTRLEGGREFGRYKEFVEEWRDSMEQYRTLLDERWGKIVILIDRQANNKHIFRAGKIKV